MLHNYKNVKFEVISHGGCYASKLDDILITGTVAQSYGESQMLTTLMIDNMQDFETKPIQAGDCIDLGNETVAVVDSIIGKVLNLRLGLGDSTTNFRGPAFTDEVYLKPYCKLDGEMLIKELRDVEWVGVYDVEFRAYADKSRLNTFKYTRESNIWKLK